MRERFFSVLAVFSKPAISIGGALAVGAVVVGVAWYATTASPSGNFAPVGTGSITEEVDVSGVVKAAHSTDLAFQTSGRVWAIRAAVGDHVYVGQMLATLDSSSQISAIALAKANLEAQQAKLDALTAGTRPEQLAIDQTAVAQAANALANALAAAYTNADDAVHAKADQVFTNPRNSTAQLAILVPDATLVNRIQAERIALEQMFSSWSTLLVSAANNPQGAVASSQANLQDIGTFLNDLTVALAETQPNGSVSAATLTGYQTTVNTGRLNVSAALSTLISADTAYKAATGALTLAQAGATENDVNVQKASVDAARASVDAAEAAASQAVIVAPVSGTITAQNASLGETVVPGVPLVSMIADGKYQVDAQVSETDIAKVKVNDTVQATFPAYPGVTFDAIVTTVDPAATMNGGIASYGITVTFLDNDPRLLPGLSANLRIITVTKNAALTVPTSAIIRDGNKEFVYVKKAAGVLQTPVTTGIESASGMTEILSGLSATDTVLTFGARPL
ncbi:MAG: efflux RND transporter periplasmic adaptor subunit [Patescibacteria group bacterium]|nr:efflux RND transporter periplasmic adaptor subunit [Patescibacteria group bacterium]